MSRAIAIQGYSSMSGVGGYSVVGVVGYFWLLVLGLILSAGLFGNWNQRLG
jgi:hypothetical protein